ncbi:MAG: hypothetical protein VB112_03525 [Oscillospiraceae bacterium]|nr:hypothetical protein [Oscillospiraceae bacterium]
MSETENKKRKTYVAFIVTAAVFLVAGALLGFALAGKFTAGSEGVQRSHDLVYNNLAACGESLGDYKQTGDASALYDARDAIEKVAAVCTANGDFYGYRDDSDNASDAIQKWGINFVISVYDYLDDACRGDISSVYKDANAVALATAFAPDDGGNVNFMSLYWNCSNSTLPQLSGSGPFEVTVVAENGVVAMREFK